MSVILSVIYLIATVTFVVGLKRLGHPDTAKSGNIIAASGMGLAILGTICIHDLNVAPIIYILIGVAIVLGSIIGYLIAIKVEMTKMPELVSLFNGFGGASAALIGLVELSKSVEDSLQAITIVSGIIIGAITFSGSLVAWGKLNGSLKSVVKIPQYNIVNNLFFLAIVGLAIFMIVTGSYNSLFTYGVLAGGLVYGILFVLPIGGADMPVVISLLNSLTGIAAAITGILYDNMVMLVGGILVGSAGIILTVAMCKAMNRTLASVIFGAFGAGNDAIEGGNKTQGTIKKTTASDAAIMMNYATNVIIVPGYGLAVAQAQHVIHELEEILTDKGVNVKYAVHPVAGRMPGHMNVLLAESNVDYNLLIEMEDINPQFSNADVVLVVGANDVVNPAAHNDPSSPIYGMPILDVENAKHIVVNKRSMNAGYAGIQNELFFNSKTSMLFGDAKAALTELVGELKNM
ncbi:NAD(P)(+) transhydrogenase (Re/Si-specific) subunit beta [Hyunsoonleella pacifica]|uniref:NAD(P) transhydrogenase subunit beta n=1 Tax=Hyunsoonleella pacifica TaxID=1080224 RepID=A0A4Q9FQV0_9FLAO|nr:NAD(P)(+) transhydrogenase (Re/Si-specific) subunit beta [Hyunsoonleella pacifica]TBN17750.1 NAD(P)(+) transhydrogenase (Re/Si-specific) subunit beta [Hyunsoonleella pacifica]GGD09248.1 NAD(P) transhydrogenase subunit beta [Hyunsoonleella pacifica]